MDDKHGTILVVDDSPGDIQLLSGLLSDRYRVKVATNARKTTELAATAPQPDVILLDVLMPGMDGYELCRQLKRSVVTRHIPIIFVTGNVTDDEKQRGLDLGAEMYLSKPVDPERLIASVRRFVG